jgi:SAM-dependent methyltransferase
MESMNLFWEALYDYHKWNQKWPFYLVTQNWEKFEQDLAWYFRSENEINNDVIEKALFENVSWNNLLDIWCATAYYFPIIAKKVKIFKWIDISKLALQVAIERWIKNVEKFNIMSDKINEKFDIITLMWNNLSIWWDIEWTKKYLKILRNILTPNGKILSIFMDLRDEDYYISENICEYNWKKSKPFKWIRINIKYLERLLNEVGLKLKILEKDDYGYCLEIKIARK